MRPFDLDKALAGEKVCTRDGKEVRDLTFRTEHVYPIRAELQDGGFSSYQKDGRCYSNMESKYDLFMAEDEPEENPKEPTRGLTIETGKSRSVWAILPELEVWKRQDDRHVTFAISWLCFHAYIEF